jgi:hypothetical protein
MPAVLLLEKIELLKSPCPESVASEFSGAGAKNPRYSATSP